MSEKKTFFIVEQSALPEVFEKVVQVKSLVDSGKEKSILEAVKQVGLSRSAFYKYRDKIFPFYEKARGGAVTLSVNLDDEPGILSHILAALFDGKANILTINQTIPLNNCANVTITFETRDMCVACGELIETLRAITGVQSLKIIARE